MHQPAVQDTPEGVVLTIHVQPKASKTEYGGLHGDALKFRVAAPPVEGAANDALCAHLAALFAISKQSVVIKAGTSSRHKRVLLCGISALRVKDILQI